MKYGDIIGRMTLEEKAALMSGRDFWSTTEYEKYGVPSAYLSDGPHGIRKQAAASDHLGLNESLPATCFPTAAAMACSWNEKLGEELGKRLGEEAAAQGVNVLLGPGLNVKRNPLCGRNFEYFSEDPCLAGKMAAAYVRGIQKNGVAACVKHFAANNQELRRMVVDSVTDERTLREIYLTGFEIAVVEGGANAVMSSYNRLNGTHANENMHLMRDILRGEWGFEGVVVTDWAGCNDRVAGVKAGNELEMPSCLYGNDDIVAAVREGRLDESAVDECLDRLLDLVFRTDGAIKSAPDSFDKEEHHVFAQKCAEESIVLLKNAGNILPLKEGRVAVIGDFAENPRYQGAGSSVVNPTRLDNFLSCLKAGENACGFDYVGYAKGFDRYGRKKPRLEKEALALAERADTVLFFAGLDEVSEAEGIDRKNMKLPVNQTGLIGKLCAAGKKVIVVLSAGSAVELDFADADEVRGILYACLGGQAGARAVYAALTGEINPSGKLAESFPFRYEDCPSAAYFPGKAATAEYREGIFVGYRYYATAGVPVRYPFGYGLSYTRFAYSDLEVGENGVRFTLTNEGSEDGAEVAQLYVSKTDGGIFRPALELKGFCKAALKAGESRRVEIPFDERTFRYFDIKTKKWEEEGGGYAIIVAASSEDVRLKGEIFRRGTVESTPYERSALPSYYTGKVADVSGEEFARMLGRSLPESGYVFYKKNRMVIGENSTVADLRYSRRWVGRLFSFVIRFAHAFLWKIGKRTAANTVMMGVYHQPVRGLAKFGAMSRRQMEGLIMMFNGHFFKGIARVMFRGGDKKSAACGEENRTDGAAKGKD